MEFCVKRSDNELGVLRVRRFAPFGHRGPPGPRLGQPPRLGPRCPARGRARFSRANRVERREFFEVPYMSHRERTAWLCRQSRATWSPVREIPCKAGKNWEIGG